jgi:AcrR family transcriptional regulator
MAGASAPQPRLGRPRRKPQSTDLPPAEEILLYASRLFAEQSFDGTSTRQIAEAAGIHQSTLFHYFPTKVDILKALSERALEQPLHLLEEISDDGASEAVKLYRIVHFHTKHLCANPFDLSALLQQPQVDLNRKRFRRWHERMERYTHLLGTLIENGIAAGEFVDCDSQVRTFGLLGMCNNAIRWFRPGGRLTADDVGHEFARTIVRSLLAEPATLDDVAAEAVPGR